MHCSDDNNWIYTNLFKTMLANLKLKTGDCTHNIPHTSRNKHAMPTRHISYARVVLGDCVGVNDAGGGLCWA